jgi:hypothetical protein
VIYLYDTSNRLYNAYNVSIYYLNTTMLKEVIVFKRRSRNSHVNLKIEEFEPLDFMKT